MRRLFSRIDARRLGIIEELNNQYGWIRIKELAQTLKYSERTIYDDVISLNDDYKKYLNIETSSIGVRLRYTENNSVDAIYRQMIGQSRTFQFLELTFFYKNLTSEIIAKKLFLSGSTIYRLSHEINKIMVETFGIRLNPSTFQLEGEELKIRDFYTQYFYTRYEQWNWPFEDIDEDGIWEITKELVEYYKTPIDYAYLHFIKIAFSVNLQRFREGNCDRSYSGDFEVDYKDIVTNTKIEELFEAHFSMPLTCDTMLQLFSVFINDEYIFSSRELIVLMNLNEKVMSSQYYLNIMLNKLSGDYQLEIADKDGLIIAIHNAVYMAKRYSVSQDLLYKESHSFNIKFKNVFPDFYQDAIEGIETYFKLSEYEYNNDVCDNVFFTLVSYWTNLIIQLKRQTSIIKVLVLSKYNMNHAQMIIDIFQDEINTPIEFSLWRECHVDPKELAKSSYDIIISSFSLPKIVNKYVLSVDSIPTLSDLQVFEEIIYKLKIKRTLLF